MAAAATGAYSSARCMGAAGAINYFAYNFIKIHRTLRVTPAMEAKIVNRP